MSAEDVAYLDSSAIVKLVSAERESAALADYLLAYRRCVSSALARTEVVRAVVADGPQAVGRARLLLRALGLIAVDDALLDAAGAVLPVTVRSLDAIHVAAVRSLDPRATRVVTYDLRMAEAVRGYGFEVDAPA